MPEASITTGAPVEEVRMRAWCSEAGDLVVLEGALEVSTVPDARAVLHDAVDRGVADLVVDLSGVDVIDATGLGVLVGTHRRAQRAGRRLVLRGVPARIQRLLTVTRLSRVIPCEPIAPISA
jgi:anti-sigma B factor antagonist